MSRNSSSWALASVSSCNCCACSSASTSYPLSLSSPSPPPLLCFSCASSSWSCEYHDYYNCNIFFGRRVKSTYHTVKSFRHSMSKALYIILELRNLFCEFSNDLVELFDTSLLVNTNTILDHLSPLCKLQCRYLLQVIHNSTTPNNQQMKDTVSSMLNLSGEQFTTRVVFELPPRDSRRMKVSLESRKGT